MSTAPVPTPGKKSNLLGWILGLGAAAVALLVVSGLLIASFFVKGIRVREDAKQVEINTPAGQLTLGNVPAEGSGLPVYPGAARVESGGGVELTTPGDERIGVVSAHYSSPDPLEKVEAWYRERLGPEFRREGPSAKRGKIRAPGVAISVEDVAFVSDQDDVARVVSIKKQDRGAEITLVRAGKRETQ